MPDLILNEEIPKREEKHPTSRNHYSMSETSTASEMILNENQIKKEVEDAVENTVNSDISPQNHLPYIKKEANDLGYFQCTACSQLFVDSVVLEQHITTKSECSIAINFNDTKTIVEDLNEEEINDLKIRDVSSKENLAKHECAYLVKKLYGCDICGKKLISRQTLIVHHRLHTKIKPFSCNACGKSFIDKSNLNKHKKFHENNKPFTCLICNTSFVYKSYLTSHERTHSSERPYSCRICDKAFKQLGHLTSHEETHGIFKINRRQSKLKPTSTEPKKPGQFICDICKKTFSLNCNLSRHRKEIHIMGKSYGCDSCDKLFSRKEDLRNHERKNH